MGMIGWSRRGLLFLAGCTIGLITGAASVAATPTESVDLTYSPMDTRPQLAPRAVVPLSDARLRALWLAALDQPDVLTRLHAVLAIREGYAMGFTALSECAPKLERFLADPREDRLLRIEAARTLQAMDQRGIAPELAKLIARESEPTDLVLEADRVLASWRTKAATQAWGRRARNVGKSTTLRISALQAMAGVDAGASTAICRELVVDDGAPLRLRNAAAQILRGQNVEDNVALARLLAASSAAWERTMSVAALGRGDDAKTTAFLKAMIADESEVVQAAAYRRLGEIDPSLLTPWIERLSRSADATQRRLAVAAMTADGDSDRLARQLGDLSLQVRESARRALAAAGGDTGELQQVINRARQAIASDAWQAQEQGILLAAELGDTTSAPPIAALLRSKQIAVRRAAIVALRELRVEATYPALLQHLESVSQLRDGVKLGRNPSPFQRRTARARADALDRETGMTLQALAIVRYAPLEDQAREIGRKNAPSSLDVRCAAVWSLGMLHRDGSSPGAERFLLGRLNDKYGNLPEFPAVRRASAIALGWMRSETALESLRQAAQESDPDLTEVGPAAAWAIERITGERPAVPPESQPIPEWFLRPTR